MSPHQFGPKMISNNAWSINVQQNRSAHLYRSARLYRSAVTQCPRASNLHNMFTVARRSHVRFCGAKLVNRSAQRAFVDAIPAVLLPPLAFVGLGCTLWTWKCAMMILFQNKIIYMPGVPPWVASSMFSFLVKYGRTLLLPYL